MLNPKRSHTHKSTNDDDWQVQLNQNKEPFLGPTLETLCCCQSWRCARPRRWSNGQTLLTVRSKEPRKASKSSGEEVRIEFKTRTSCWLCWLISIDACQEQKRHRLIRSRARKTRSCRTPKLVEQNFATILSNTFNAFNL